MERLLRFVAAWLYTGAYWPVVITLHLLTFKRLPAPAMAAICRAWGRSTLWILGIRLEIEGPGTLETREPRVVICNHQSALDLAWGAAICPPAPLVIGKKEIIFVPVVNLIWWGLDFIRIDRTNHTKAMAALAGVSQLIVRERRSLVIAPEGTRTHNGSILRFKKGAFHIAREAGVPLCPVVVSGAYELLSRREWLPRKGVIRLRFLPPIPTAGLAHADEAGLIERVRQQMIGVLADMAR